LFGVVSTLLLFQSHTWMIAKSNDSWKHLTKCSTSVFTSSEIVCQHNYTKVWFLWNTTCLFYSIKKYIRCRLTLHFVFLCKDCLKTFTDQYKGGLGWPSFGQYFSFVCLFLCYYLLYSLLCHKNTFYITVINNIS